MSPVSVSDIIRAAELAQRIYRMGWGKELDASQNYQEFRNDIRSLFENLKKISKVVEHAKAQQSPQSGLSRGPPLQKDWDLSSLREIVGDYQKTLVECEKLLKENPQYGKKGNFAHNIEWNASIQPKVDRLRGRLHSHNSKILILLKPLELTLLREIHYDLVERIDAVQRSVRRLEGLLIQNVEQALSEQGGTLPIPLLVPTNIEKKFQTAAEKSKPEIRTRGNFPLQAGADAFVEHFEESTTQFSAAGIFINERTPPSKQYLSLLKCIWIMSRLRESDALRNAPNDSQWHGYIDQLNENLSVECQKFTTPSAKRLIEPNLSSLENADEYNIWPGENIAEYISLHFERHKEEVLKIPMPSPSEQVKCDITIYQLEPTKFRLVESVEDKNTLSTLQERKVDIDLESVMLTPIYATPSLTPKPFAVQIHSADVIEPTFRKLDHVLALQHLLTGYKVYGRYDQAMDKVSFVFSDQATREYYGRLQLWLPYPFEASSTSTSLMPSEAQSPASRSQASISTAVESMSNRRGSKVSVVKREIDS